MTNNMNGFEIRNESISETSSVLLTYYKDDGLHIFSPNGVAWYRNYTERVNKRYTSEMQQLIIKNFGDMFTTKEERKQIIEDVRKDTSYKLYPLEQFYRCFLSMRQFLRDILPYCGYSAMVAVKGTDCVVWKYNDKGDLIFYARTI